MRNKTPLVLLEQVLMVLVFALAAALCLQVFAFSDKVSREHEVRDRASVMAQNVAEVLKNCSGDYLKAAELYGGSWDGTSWQLQYDAQWTEVDSENIYLIKAVPANSNVSLLGAAEICVYHMDGEVLFQIPVAWQEVTSDA